MTDLEAGYYHVSSGGDGLHYLVHVDDDGSLRWENHNVCGHKAYCAFGDAELVQRDGAAVLVMGEPEGSGGSGLFESSNTLDEARATAWLSEHVHSLPRWPHPFELPPSFPPAE